MSGELNVHNLGKCFPRPGAQQLRSLLFGSQHVAPDDGAWVLRDMSFAVGAGETLGIVGRNGAGKSTLLRILSGASIATTGSVERRGRVAAILELGLGFNMELSGRENAITNALILGLSPKEVRAKVDQMLVFSELGVAFEKSLHCYSTGMMARLAFSVASSTSPDILLLDEALAVGDLAFQIKCSGHLSAMKGSTTMVVASHNTELLVALCDRVMWIDQGSIRELGDPRCVVEAYRAYTYGSLSRTPVTEDTERQCIMGETAAIECDSEPLSALPHDLRSYGNKRAEIVGAELWGKRNRRLSVVKGGDPCKVVLDVVAGNAIPNPVLGFVARGTNNVQLFGMNSETACAPLAPLAPGTRRRYSIHFSWPHCASGAYSISPAIADGSVGDHQMCHWLHDAVVVGCEPSETLCVGWQIGLPDATIREE